MTARLTPRTSAQASLLAFQADDRGLFIQASRYRAEARKLAEIEKAGRWINAACGAAMLCVPFAMWVAFVFFYSYN
jgi:hypothetical protein